MKRSTDLEKSASQIEMLCLMQLHQQEVPSSYMYTGSAVPTSSAAVMATLRSAKGPAPLLPVQNPSAPVGVSPHYHCPLDASQHRDDHTLAAKSATASSKTGTSQCISINSTTPMVWRLSS